TLGASVRELAAGEYRRGRSPVLAQGVPFGAHSRRPVPAEDFDRFQVSVGGTLKTGLQIGLPKRTAICITRSAGYCQFSVISARHLFAIPRNLASNCDA